MRLRHKFVCAAALALLSAGCLVACAQSFEETPPPAATTRDASLDDYRAHLEQLKTLTAACAKVRNTDACDPALVGPDDRVPQGANGERRLIRFAWLRVLFQRAQKPDEKPKPAPLPENPLGQTEQLPNDVLTTSQLLKDAQERLQDDLDQANGAPATVNPHPDERAVLGRVLDGREFRRLKQPDQGPSALEKFGNWLNSLFDWLGSKNLHARWVGRVLIWGFLAAVGVGLIWALLQMERRWRIRLVPESEGPAPGAASARDWQLWLNDARDAAARGQWREAIHFLYWAAISRLESKKLWPADRARTPREYLALVAGDDPRKPRLGALTHEFEWTWYGGRPAVETDYLRAEELATGLFEGGGPR